MRYASSYSIVDHELLHGGYLARLSHQALALYLFLCVVGDRDGRSYYSDASICRILHLSGQDLTVARDDLLDCDLICYRKPYCWVKNLSQTKRTKRDVEMPPVPHASNYTASAQSRDKLRPMRGIVPDGLKALLKALDDGGR